MITKTVNLYTFDELNDKAKEKARDWWKQSENETFGSFGELNEAPETAAKLLGIDFKQHTVPLHGGGKRLEPKIWWQLHAQGSGASFEADYSYAKGCVKNIIAEWPKDETLLSIAKRLAAFQKPYKYGVTATITTEGRSVHKFAMNLDAYNSKGEQLREEEEKALLDIMRDFADRIYEGIDQEFEYRMTDESVDESILANQYTFLDNGQRED